MRMSFSLNGGSSTSFLVPGLALWCGGNELIYDWLLLTWKKQIVARVSGGAACDSNRTLKCGLQTHPGCRREKIKSSTAGADVFQEKKLETGAAGQIHLDLKIVPTQAREDLGTSRKPPGCAYAQPAVHPPLRFGQLDCRTGASVHDYEQARRHLRDALQRFIAGEDLHERVRACYPFVGTHRNCGRARTRA